MYIKMKYTIQIHKINWLISVYHYQVVQSRVQDPDSHCIVAAWLLCMWEDQSQQSRDVMLDYGRSDEAQQASGAPHHMLPERLVVLPLGHTFLSWVWTWVDNKKA